MQGVAFIDETLAFASELFPGRFKLLQLVGLERSDDIEASLILEILKVHL